MGLDRRGANLPTVFQIRRLLAPAQLLGAQGNGFSEYVSVPQGCCFGISRRLPPLQTSHALSKQKKKGGGDGLALSFFLLLEGSKDRISLGPCFLDLVHV